MVLRRIGHSAPVHRAHLCDALRHERENTTPAFAILLVRALLEEYDPARGAAQDAIRALSPRGAEIIAVHELLSGTPKGEPVTVLLPSALLGPRPDPRFAEALEAVCELELRRFPGNDSFAVARVLASLGGPDAADRIRALLEEEQLSGEMALSVLSPGPEPWAVLRFNLETGRNTEDSLKALAGMGGAGARLWDLVVPYLREERRIRRDAVRALWGMRVRHHAVQLLHAFFVGGDLGLQISEVLLDVTSRVWS